MAKVKGKVLPIIITIIINLLLLREDVIDPIFLISTHAFRVECFRAFYQSFSGKFWIYFSNWVGCKNAEKDLRKLKSGFSHFQQKLRGYQDQQQHRITGWLQRQRTCNHNLVKNQTARVAFNTSQCIIIILPRDFLSIYVRYNSCLDDLFIAFFCIYNNLEQFVLSLSLKILKQKLGPLLTPKFRLNGTFSRQGLP